MYSPKLHATLASLSTNWELDGFSNWWTIQIPKPIVEAETSWYKQYFKLFSNTFTRWAHCPISIYTDQFTKENFEHRSKHQKIKFQEYQIAIVAFEIEDFDGDDSIHGLTERTMYGSAYALPNLLIQRVVLWSNRILHLLHHQQQRRRQKHVLSLLDQTKLHMQQQEKLIVWRAEPEAEKAMKKGTKFRVGIIESEL